MYFELGSSEIVARSASLPFNKREVKVIDYLFLLPQGVYTCYIRLKSNFPMQVPVQLTSLQDFTEKSHTDNNSANI